jgi:hypothetical protein
MQITALNQKSEIHDFIDQFQQFQTQRDKKTDKRFKTMVSEIIDFSNFHSIPFQDDTINLLESLQIFNPFVWKRFHNHPN